MSRCFHSQKTPWFTDVRICWNRYRNNINQQLVVVTLIIYPKGEWRGLVVSTEDFHSKGWGIESRSFSFFFSDEKFLSKPLSSLLSPKLVSSIWMHDAREGKEGTPGELMKKNRQAFQERSTGLEKGWTGSFRRRLNGERQFGTTWRES